MHSTSTIPANPAAADPDEVLVGRTFLYWWDRHSSVSRGGTPPHDPSHQKRKPPSAAQIRVLNPIARNAHHPARASNNPKSPETKTAALAVQGTHPPTGTAQKTPIANPAIVSTTPVTNRIRFPFASMLQASGMAHTIAVEDRPNHAIGPHPARVRHLFAASI